MIKAFKIINLIYEIKKLCYKFIHQYLTFEKINEIYFKSKKISLGNFFNNTSKHFFIFFSNLLEAINKFSLDENIDKEFYNDDKDILRQCQTAIVGIINNQDPEKASYFLVSKLIELINTTCGSIKLLCKELDEKIGLLKFENGKIVPCSLEDVDAISKIPKARIFLFFEELMLFLNKPVTYFNNFDAVSDISTSIKLRSTFNNKSSPKKDLQINSNNNTLPPTPNNNNNTLPPSPTNSNSPYTTHVGGASSSQKMSIKNKTNLNVVVKKGLVAKEARKKKTSKRKNISKYSKLVDSELLINQKLYKIQEAHIKSVFGEDFNIFKFQTDKEALNAFSSKKYFKKVHQFISQDQNIIEFAQRDVSGDLKSHMVNSEAGMKKFSKNLFELYNIILENLLNLAKSNLVVYMIFTNPDIQKKINISVSKDVMKAAKKKVKENKPAKKLFKRRLSGELAGLFQNTCIDLKQQLPCFSEKACNLESKTYSQSSSKQHSLIKLHEGAPLGSLIEEEVERVPLPRNRSRNSTVLNVNTSTNNNTNNNSEFINKNYRITYVGKKSNKKKNVNPNKKSKKQKK